MSKAPSKRPRGRPSKFTQAIADELCLRVGAGETLASICREAHMPAVNTVNDWRRDDETFSAAFGRARNQGFDAIAERLHHTARGKGAAEGGDSSGDVARDKLIIDTDLKLLAKWDPRRYGDRVTHAGDPDQPVSVEVKPAAALAKELVDALRQGKASA